MPRLICALLLASAPALAANPGPGPAGPAAAQILSKIHAANLAEIRAGELAMRQGNNPQVRAYGERLMRDHRYADNRALAMAGTLGVQLRAVPQQPQQPPPAGPGFDRAFLEQMEASHQQAIAMLTAAAPRLQNRRLAGLVDNLVPILQQHLAVARALLRTAQPNG